MSRPQRKSPEALEGALGAHGGAQVGGAEQGRTYREPRISVQRNRPPHSRNLPAAVIEAHHPATADAPRVVPEGACVLKVGGTVLGYCKRQGKASIRTIRLQEIERIIVLRYGAGGCDCDDAAVYAILGINTLVPTLLQSYAGRPGVHDLIMDRVIGWCAQHVPAISTCEVRRIAERAIREPKLFRADSAARLIHLTMAERTAARVSTIGAIDCSREARAAIALDAKRRRDREAKEAKRREAGARSKEEVHATSVAEQCRLMGISRSTYYRWLRQGKLLPSVARDTNGAPHKEDPSDRRHECVTPKAAKPPTTHRIRPFQYYIPVTEVRPTANASAARAWDAATGSRLQPRGKGGAEPTAPREPPVRLPPERQDFDALSDLAWRTLYAEGLRP